MSKNPNYYSEINQIKTLLNKGRVQDAINRLLKIDEAQSFAMIIARRFHQRQQDNNAGLLTDEEFEKKKRRVTKEITRYLDERLGEELFQIEEGKTILQHNIADTRIYPEVSSDLSESKKSNSLLILGGGVLFVLAALLVSYNLFGDKVFSNLDKEGSYLVSNIDTILSPQMLYPRFVDNVKFTTKSTPSEVDISVDDPKLWVQFEHYNTKSKLSEVIIDTEFDGSPYHNLKFTESATFNFEQGGDNYQLVFIQDEEEKYMTVQVDLQR